MSYVWRYTPKIWLYMVQYLRFRIPEIPFIVFRNVENQDWIERWSRVIQLHEGNSIDPAENWENCVIPQYTAAFPLWKFFVKKNIYKKSCEGIPLICSCYVSLCSLWICDYARFITIMRLWNSTVWPLASAVTHWINPTINPNSLYDESPNSKMRCGLI